eukprot:1719667-Rhodomonas_salina.1
MLLRACYAVSGTESTRSYGRGVWCDAEWRTESGDSGISLRVWYGHGGVRKGMGESEEGDGGE